MKNLLIFTLSCLLTLPIAQADILMADMNGSYSEITSVREAAVIRGEKLIIIPETPEDIRKQSWTLTTEMTILKNQYEAKLDKMAKYKTTDAQYKKLDSEYQDLTKKYNEKEVKQKKLVSAYQLTDINMPAIIKKLSDKKYKFTSVVMSGHSGGTSIWGINGSISLDPFFKELEKYPAMSSGIIGLYGSACYMMAPGYVNNWVKTMPSLDVCYGYFCTGPGNQTSAACSTIKDALIKQNQLANLKTPNQTSNALWAIDEAKYTNAALYTNGSYANIKGEKDKLSNFLDCADAKADIAKEQSDFDQYFNAKDEAHADPSVNSGTTLLRAYYNEVQNLSANCRSKLNLPVNNVMLSMIKYQHIKENFQLWYGHLTKRVNKALSSVGCKTVPDYSDSATTRKKIKELIPVAQNCFNWKWTEAVTKKKIPAQDARVTRYILYMTQQMLIDMKCIPIETWIEEQSDNDHLAAPKC